MNQIMETNLWLRHVSDVYDVYSLYDGGTDYGRCIMTPFFFMSFRSGMITS